MNGSIVGAIIAGVVLTAVAFAHPIGPALMLAAETPFDAVPWDLFGVLGNLITYVPILIFLVKVNPAYWGQAFLGTRIQQLAAFLLIALLYSHAVAVVDIGTVGVIEYLRKVTLFLLLGIFAFYMRDTRRLPLFVKTLVVSMAVFTFLSMLDFYLGIRVLPIKAGVLEHAALDTQYETWLATSWRFTGTGYPVNRFSNYLLPIIFLGIGWFMSVRSPLQRGMALACAALLVMAELFTVTRSGILAMGIGMAIMLPMAMRFRPQEVIGLAIVAGLLGLLAWYGLTLTSADAVISKRFALQHVEVSTGGRLARIIAAFKIWADHPFVGVGWGNFRAYSVEYLREGGKGAHNGFTNVLAQAGLLGFLPLVIWLYSILRRSLVRVGSLSPELEFWRPYFFCGLVAQLVTNIFNDYMWERYLWMSFAFVAVLEHRYLVARSLQARERLEADRARARQPSHPLPARAPGV